MLHVVCMQGTLSSGGKPLPPLLKKYDFPPLFMKENHFSIIDSKLQCL